MKAVERRIESAEDVPILLPDALSDQHEHQRRYFDAEFAEYERYDPRELAQRRSTQRIFGALGVFDGGSPVSGHRRRRLGSDGDRGGPAWSRGGRLRPLVRGCSPPAGLRAAEGVDGLARFVVCAAEALPFATPVRVGERGRLLEHLDDDRPSVAELARVVRPGGLLWLTVPHAFRYMLPLVWPFYWWHDRRIGHKRHYDEARLVRLCAEVGSNT